MKRLENILAENMRRFGTKNLVEHDIYTSRSSKQYLIEQSNNKMSFLYAGSPKKPTNQVYKDSGFYGVSYTKNIISSVKNTYFESGVKKSTESQQNAFTSAEQLGIPGNGGTVDTSIAFNYVTTVKNGDRSSLTISATSANGNAESETYTLQDGTYLTRFSIINLPYNSVITITANDDNENKLVITTGAETQQSQTNKSTEIINKLKKGKSTYTYYSLDKNAKTLAYATGYPIDVTTTVIIDNWDFNDGDEKQVVYVAEINDNKVTLQNTAGTAVVTIK